MIKVMISGGGTGGHIFPALSIANAIKEKYSGSEFLFVGAIGKMEMEKIPAAGYKIIGLPITGIARSLSMKNLAFPFKLMKSIRISKKLIKEFKPDVVVGVGGFASGPLLYAASKMGIPTLIQEQNSYPGITNKILARRVDKICVAYDGMDKFFPKERIRFTGNPIRKDIINLSGKRERGIEKFGFDGNRKVIFVTGGSLGSKTLNECTAAALSSLEEKKIQLLWQTGLSYENQAKEFLKNFPGLKSVCVPFIKEMDYAYAVADVVVSRAGAGALSELCMVHKAAVLVPYPFAAEDHQTKNAQALVNHKAAIMITDRDAHGSLFSAAIELVLNDEERQKLEENISKLAVQDAAETIASEVYNLAKLKA